METSGGEGSKTRGCEELQGEAGDETPGAGRVTALWERVTAAISQMKRLRVPGVTGLPRPHGQYVLAKATPSDSQGRYFPPSPVVGDAIQSKP